MFMAHCTSSAEDINRADANIKGKIPTLLVCMSQMLGQELAAKNSIPTLLVCMCQMLGQELAARTRFLPCLYACAKCLDKN